MAREPTKNPQAPRVELLDQVGVTEQVRLIRSIQGQLLQGSRTGELDRTQVAALKATLDSAHRLLDLLIPKRSPVNSDTPADVRRRLSGKPVAKDMRAAFEEARKAWKAGKIDDSTYYELQSEIRWHGFAGRIEELQALAERMRGL